MQKDVFYERLAAIFVLPPRRRRARMAELHTQVFNAYRDLVASIDAGQAARRSQDGRTVAQVVGHIGEWDRYCILASGELLAGSPNPQLMSLRGYVEDDGNRRDFKDVSDFNAYQAERHAAWPWERIQGMAIRSAWVLYRLQTDPRLFSSLLLEQTAPYTDRLANGTELVSTVGWYLWAITLEHEAVEHNADLEAHLKETA